MSFWQALNKRWFIILCILAIVWGLTFNPLGAMMSTICIFGALALIVKAENKVKKFEESI